MYHRRLTAGVNAARAVRLTSTPTRPAAARVQKQRLAEIQMQPRTRSLQTSAGARNLHPQAQVVSDEAKSPQGSHAAAEKKMQDAEAAASFAGAYSVRAARRLGRVIGRSASTHVASAAHLSCTTELVS